MARHPHPPDENAGDAVERRGPIRPEDDEAPPPVLGRWRNVYAVVLAELGVLVALFYALTKWAS